MRARLLALPVLAALALPVQGQDHDHGRDHDGDHAFDHDWAPEFHDLEQGESRVLPLKQAAAIVAQRFRGRLIAARIVPPTPDERARGVALVHELRLLTPARDVLAIRLDAHSGAFLEVAGAGLTQARRKGSSE